MSVEQADFDTAKLIEALESEGFGGSVVGDSDGPAADDPTDEPSDVPPADTADPTDGEE